MSREVASVRLARSVAIGEAEHTNLPPREAPDRWTLTVSKDNELGLAVLTIVFRGHAGKSDRIDVPFDGASVTFVRFAAGPAKK